MPVNSAAPPVAFWPEAVQRVLPRSDVSFSTQRAFTCTNHCVVNIFGRQQLRLCSSPFLISFSFLFFSPLVSFPVNKIRACLKEFGRTCLYKEFLRESEGNLQGERSMPKLHCCYISHGGKSERARRWLVEMSGTSFSTPLETFTLCTLDGSQWSRRKDSFVVIWMK